MTSVHRLINDPRFASEKFRANYQGSDNVPTIHHELNFLNDPPRDNPVIIPDVMEFSVSKNTLEMDWIATKSSHDIFSNRLIDVIESVGSIEWTLVPVRLFVTSDKLVYEEKFSCVLYNEYLDCLDYENSEYRPGISAIRDPKTLTPRQRKKVGTIKQIKLIEPVDGFPPLFRLLARPTELLVSEKSHDAIVNAKLNVRLFPLSSR